MKTAKFTTALFLILATVAVIGCKNQTEAKAEDLKDAQEKVVVAKQELSAARLDSINEYAKYRTEVDKKLIENDKQIAEIRAKNKLQKAEMRTKLDKDLDDLMKKNEDFKVEMKNQKDGAYTSWESFKGKFNTDMDELGKSISGMAHNNMNNK